jgi:drug/metabolite transporter (DMT)-like permease
VSFLYGLICLIWGSTWLAIKVGLNGVPPFLGAGLRFLLSTLIVGAVLLARRQPIRLTRNDRLCIGTLGVLVFWFDYAAVYWAETRISSGLTAILFSTMPLMTALLSAFWTRTETLDARKIVGVIIGVVGTVLLFYYSAGAASPALLAGEGVSVSNAAGMLAALGASLCAAINLVVMKRYGHDSDPFVLNFFGMGIGTAGLLAMSVVFEGNASIDWNTGNVISIVYLAVLGSVVAFSAYYALIKVMDATLVSLSTLIIPVIALVLGRVFLDEAFAPMAVLGVATIMAGVGLVLVSPEGRRTKLQSSVRI